MQATERISLRTTPQAKELIEQASSLMGVSISQFILSTVYEKSLQMVQQQQVWQANRADLQQLEKLLNEPAEANEELKALLKLGENLA